MNAAYCCGSVRARFISSMISASADESRAYAGPRALFGTTVTGGAAAVLESVLSACGLFLSFWADLFCASAETGRTSASRKRHTAADKGSVRGDTLFTVLDSSKTDR